MLYKIFNGIKYLLFTDMFVLRLGPIDVEPVVAQGLEDQLRSSSDDSEEDGDHLPVEWERVGDVII